MSQLVSQVNKSIDQKGILNEWVNESVSQSVSIPACDYTSQLVSVNK